MNRWIRLVFPAGLAIALGSVSSSEGREGFVRDDQGPWGPMGRLAAGPIIFPRAGRPGDSESRSFPAMDASLDFPLQDTTTTVAPPRSHG